MKKINKILLSVFLLFFSIFSLFVLHNNVGFTEVNQNELNVAFEESVAWIVENQEAILKENNSILWWMLIEASSISKNDKLKQVVDKYRDDNYSLYYNSPWSYLIYESDPNVVALDILTAGFPDYIVHIIYGFSCNTELENSEIVSTQNATAFCFENHPVSPACLTHQLMGFRFMQRTGCGVSDIVAKKINDISSYIEYQAIFDCRVVDVYLQRVLMLLDSGKRDKINDRWIRRIIDSQLPDGGWGSFQPLIPIGSGRFIGFSANGLSVDSPRSIFHTTAQGVLLLAILVNGAPPGSGTKE